MGTTGVRSHPQQQTVGSEHQVIVSDSIPTSPSSSSSSSSSVSGWTPFFFLSRGAERVDAPEQV